MLTFMWQRLLYWAEPIQNISIIVDSSIGQPILQSNKSITFLSVPMTLLKKWILICHTIYIKSPTSWNMTGKNLPMDFAWWLTKPKGRVHFFLKILLCKNLTAHHSWVIFHSFQKTSKKYHLFIQMQQELEKWTIKFK